MLGDGCGGLERVLVVGDGEVLADVTADGEGVGLGSPDGDGALAGDFDAGFAPPDFEPCPEGERRTAVPGAPVAGE